MPELPDEEPSGPWPNRPKRWTRTSSGSGTVADGTVVTADGTIVTTDGVSPVAGHLTDQQFLESSHRRLLGRELDAADHLRWIGDGSTPLDRSEVLRWLSSTKEFSRKFPFSGLIGQQRAGVRPRRQQPRAAPPAAAWQQFHLTLWIGTRGEVSEENPVL